MNDFTFRATFALPRTVESMYAEAESRVQCTCGLLAVGYHGGWGISHNASCPVEIAYRQVVAKEAFGGASVTPSEGGSSEVTK